MNILLLGPGTSTKRFGEKPFGSDPSDKLTVIDLDDASLAFWVGADVFKWDLEITPYPLPADTFDEIHAYEVFHLLSPDAESFFSLWKELWRVLKPGGRVIGTTPWFQSKWLWSDPGTKRVYTEELLAYLNQVRRFPAMTNYSRLYPAPHSFKTVLAEQYGDKSEGLSGHGFRFVLEKECK